MATTTRVLTASVNGTVYTSNANGALEAVDTCHSGTTAPTNEVANGKFWLDTSTTPAILKMYNNAVWEVIGGSTSSPTFAGLTTTADVTFGDNDKAIFGAGSDLAIFHNGSNSYVQDSGTGILIIQGSTGVHVQGRDATDMIRANEGSAVELYHNDIQKFATSSTGVDVSGNITASGTSPTIYIDETDTSATHRILSDGGALYIQAKDSDGTNDGDLYLTGYLNTDLRLLGISAVNTNINGELDVTGTVTAAAFAGDGSSLTGISITTAQVGTATAGLAVGAVGSYAFLGKTTAVNAGVAYTGLNYAGSAGAEGSSTNNLLTTDAAVAGTWRAMGDSDFTSKTLYVTLFLRIA